MSNRDDLFERALAGELAWDCEELDALRREDQDAAWELDELLALQGALEARAERAGTSAVTDGDRSLVAGALERLHSADGTPPATPGETRRLAQPARRTALSRLGLAAAALVIALAGWWWSSQAPEQEDIVLGGSEAFEAITPVGLVESFTEFRVVGDLPTMAVCELRIWAASDAAGARPRVTRKFRGLAWSPADDERLALPDVIRWEVVVFDSPPHDLGGTGMVRAERRRD